KVSLSDCIIDREIVALKKGITSFSLLQSRFGINATNNSTEKIKIYYYAFDILYCDGYLVTHLPLMSRKKILKNLIPFKGIFRYVTHKNGKGEVYLKKACIDKWEGLIAKKKDSSYISKRSTNWIKLKCVNEQEFVIGGYTNSTNPQLDFGALLLGYYEKGTLHYAEKVGTGFNRTILKEVGAKLKSYEIKKNPFHNYDDSTKNIHWVKPILVRS